MATGDICVFGATGFTAGLVLETLLRSGTRPVLVARDLGRLHALGGRLSLDVRGASADDPGALRRAFTGASVVLNAAGPFAETVKPVVRACLEVGAHYVDVSGEVDAIESAATFHEEARQRGITVLPAAGFDVVPSDCLAAHVARRSTNASVLRVAVSGLELLSPGSAKTLAAELGRPTRVRRGGRLVEIEPGSLGRKFDFGAGPAASVAVTWGDLATAYYSTGIDTIETYFEATPGVLATVQSNRYFGSLYRLPWVRAGIDRQVKWWTRTPSREERLSRRATIVVQAEDATGRRVESRLVTPEAYTLTAETAAEIAKRLLAGESDPGFQTVSRTFGADFILGFAGVSRFDVEDRP
jgi:short subunit dehydrogenase-like uncharacterized protein